jgi:hypothetical protein
LKGFLSFGVFHRMPKYRRVVLTPRRWRQVGGDASLASRPATVTTKPDHRMFWRNISLNINVVRGLYRWLCRDPQKMLIAGKKFQRRPLMRLRPRPLSQAPMSTQRMDEAS